MKKYTICNPIMFALIMKNPVLCRGLLERIFPGRKIREIRLISPEEEESEEKVGTEVTILTGIETKSIRMDVLFEDDDAWYDIELQLHPGDHPAKRSRFYHGTKTVNSLAKGEPYSDLKQGYVIFICLFDLFQMNRPVYSFQMYDEKNCLPLGDGQYTIFLNAACIENVPKELDGFFRYLRTGEVQKGDSLLTQMDQAVEAANRQEEVRIMATVQDEMERMQTIADRMRAQIKVLEVDAEAMQKQIEEKQREVDAKQQELDEKQQEVNAKQQELDEKQQEVDAKQQELDDVKADAEKMNRLTAMLLENNRTEDLLKAVNDPEIRQRLMEELL